MHVELKFVFEDKDEAAREIPALLSLSAAPAAKLVDPPKAKAEKAKPQPGYDAADLLAQIAAATSTDQIGNIFAENPGATKDATLKAAGEARIKELSPKAKPIEEPKVETEAEVPYADLQAVVLKAAAKDRGRTLAVAQELGAENFKVLPANKRALAITMVKALIEELEA